MIYQSRYRATSEMVKNISKNHNVDVDEMLYKQMITEMVNKMPLEDLKKIFTLEKIDPYNLGDKVWHEIPDIEKDRIVDLRMRDELEYITKIKL